MIDEIVLVDIEKIDAPTEADRDIIDPDKIRELAESIRSQGLHSPILVRPMNGRYEIVFGHRRLLAHRLIGELKIRSMIKEMTDDQVFEARAVENDQREDLNPIERAKTYKRLRDRFNMSNRQIAQKMGRSPGVVDKYLHLLEIPEEFQDAVAKKKVGIDVAVTLNKIEDEEFKKFYFASAVENGVTIEVAQMWLTDWRKTRTSTAYDSPGGGGDYAPSNEIPVVYGTCACCVGPVKTNELVYIPVCRECAGQIKGALKPNGTK